MQDLGEIHTEAGLRPHQPLTEMKGSERESHE